MAARAPLTISLTRSSFPGISSLSWSKFSQSQTGSLHANISTPQPQINKRVDVISPQKIIKRFVASREIELPCDAERQLSAVGQNARAEHKEPQARTAGELARRDRLFLRQFPDYIPVIDIRVAIFKNKVPRETPTSARHSAETASAHDLNSQCPLPHTAWRLVFFLLQSWYGPLQELLCITAPGGTRS